MCLTSIYTRIITSSKSHGHICERLNHDLSYFLIYRPNPPKKITASSTLFSFISYLAPASIIICFMSVQTINPSITLLLLFVYRSLSTVTLFLSLSIRLVCLSIRFPASSCLCWCRSLGVSPPLPVHLPCFSLSRHTLFTSPLPFLFSCTQD